jgi:hypothetical protein
MEENYIVYIKTDTENRIIAINSSAFLTDATDWIQIDEGLGDKYHHAQGNYLEKGLVGENGCYNYKFVGGEVVERTESERQQDILNTPQPPTSEERLTAIEDALLMII